VRKIEKSNKLREDYFSIRIKMFGRPRWTVYGKNREAVVTSFRGLGAFCSENHLLGLRLLNASEISPRIFGLILGRYPVVGTIERSKYRALLKVEHCSSLCASVCLAQAKAAFLSPMGK
jgi:hypothetical protein